MAISENSLHPYIKGLVEEFGVLTVTDLNIYLRDILELDDEDLSILSGRNDDKFSQIVRNVVAHAPIGVSMRNGYIIDKTAKPARFYAISEARKNAKSATTVTKDEIKFRQNKKKQFNARKIDFHALNIERTTLGDAGERFALDWERNRLKELAVEFDVLDEVIHFSRKYGDGAGYDILSRKDNNYELLYIEVKTTTRGLKEPFYMSENERVFMEIYSDKTFIYRVYNFDYERNIGEIEIISYNDLNNKYVFNPVTFKVTRKE